MTDATRPFVLVSAHHCAPDMGSEHAVGWNLVSRLAQQHPLLLVTQDNEYRPAIEARVQALRDQGLTIHTFYVLHGSRTDGRANNLRLFYYLTYRQYQRRVLALARQLVRQYDVAAVHHLTIVGFREPGDLWQLGLPFVWGPVGGLVDVPRVLYGEMPPKSRLFQGIRAVITAAQFRLSARVAQAYRAAQRPGGSFIAATQDIGERFVRRFGGRYEWIPETGAHLEAAPPAPPARDAHAPLRLLWTGALIDRKPMEPLLEAIATLPGHRDRIQLIVVGDGDSRPRFEAAAQRLGVNATFAGWRPHDEVRGQYADADLYVLLSLLDLTTNVVFEALAAGLPVLCLDHHGYAGIVTPACGIKLPVCAQAELRAAIAAALARLLDDRALLAPMRAAARLRAAEFTWDRNAAALGALYDHALAQRRTPS